MGWGSSNGLGENCKKTDSNEWTCKFPDKEGDVKAKLVYRGSKDGDLEPMERQFDADLSDEEKKKLAKRATDGVKVKSNEDVSSPTQRPVE